MNKGILIFAHNNKDIDYILMSLISAKFAKKNLQVPISLVSDDSTLAWAKKSDIYNDIQNTFDKIIIVDKPETNNYRRLNDGIFNKTVPFVNANRYSAWDLTPYDRTLLIDSDFLIMSNRLNEYWDLDEDVLISKSINDIYDQKRIGYHDRYVSDTGVHLYWATTVMFTKNQKGKFFFDLVNYVRKNYGYYGDLFRFNTQQYRNDISFSVAKHILDGFETNTTMSLPPILTTIDTDILSKVNDNNLIFLIKTGFNDDDYSAASVSDTDIHIMNKQSFIRNKDTLMEIA
jgi:hypothetical protein